jgi:hypothetical protein
MTPDECTELLCEVRRMIDEVDKYEEPPDTALDTWADGWADAMDAIRAHLAVLESERRCREVGIKT